ncbi:DUF5776 domain-containing protein [Apilactobacillus kunkeei]|uniref:DUF5776 domain-containing protein n=1 Tax=Apilactobacillus kunkeei TaxID=148814 RepID=UPI00167C9F2B|nr:hypothetical protein [Apilactobacillus kunkeei]
MTKYNKLLSKCAVLLATLGAGATLASAHVAAHAASSNDGWEDGVVYTGSVDAPGISAEDKARVQKMINTPESEANKRADAKDDARLAKLNKLYLKQQAEYDAKMDAVAKKNHVKDYDTPSETAETTGAQTTPSKKTTTKKVAKKSSAKKASTKKTTKKHAKKAAAKKVTKKHVKKSSAKKDTKKVAKRHVKKATVKKATKKVAKKHAKRLFSIRVKAHKIYAYKSANIHHKQGRKAEKKGTKLYVYGIVKKGHKTFYKVYGGRVITSNKHFVVRTAR